MNLYACSLILFSAFVVPCFAFNVSQSQIANEKIINFIDNHMGHDITLLFDNITDYDWLLRRNFSKMLITHNLQEPLYLHGNNSYILMIKNQESLDKSIDILRKTHWNTRRPHLLIYTEPPTKRDVKQSLSKLLYQQIYNAAIYGGNTIYTWYPYDEQSGCASKVNLKKVGRKNDPFLEKIPRKLNGCRINVTWNYMSIMVADPNDKTTHPGALVAFLDAVAEGMNVQVDYLRNNTEFYKTYLHNNSFSALVGDMEARRIDTAIYMAYNGFALVGLENSRRIYQSNTYVLLPPRRKSRQMNCGINLYPPSLVTCLFAFLLTSTVVWKAISKRTVTVSILNVLQLAVQGGLSRVPTYTSVRIFLLFLLLAFMCLNIVYYTQLSSVLTKPGFQPKIRSLKTLLLDTDIKIMSFHATVKHLKVQKSLTEAFMEKLIPMKGIFGERILAEEIFKEAIRATSVGVTCLEFHLNFFKNREKLEVMYDEPLNPGLYFLAMKRGHPLMEAVNFWIDTLKEMGLMEKYLRDVSVGLKKITVAQPSHLDKEKLGFVHVEGAFVILSVGSLIAAVAFALEISYGRNRGQL